MTRRSHMDRRALFATGAAAALLAATGVSVQASPSRKGRLRAALSGASRTDRFDARQDHGLFMQVAMAGAVFDTLTEVAADGTLHGELSTAWEGDARAQVWTLTLRDDVDFHDGTRFAAQDVVASFDLHRDTLLADVARVAVLDARRVLVELHRGDPDFPYRLSDPRLVMYPSRNIAEAMRDGIGTGLYRVQRFQPGRHFLGARVAHHYKDGRAGWFDTVELVALSSSAVRAEALRDNYVDAAELSDTADLADLSGITLLPETHAMTAAVSQGLALPAQTGRRWPLDNLRAAERWWMA
ncbi:peptide ABC transporter substrate-binding protein [Roseobacter denitrificans]|uniref:ABC transporter, substrate-binding protein n=1 Tax=Roseobacter denitrificans (strain ATCC 33942 / OCh 114) TaxID=375451 RepID=Q16D34_ROSDO|nr:ABC transporter substrate-binding protein [Roseobacter denitrificans]ABG30109.1 ABC transporter, substrate-binding protein [Roseobacter denitrificans OCh 114]AVL53303.1 peptide ABC transporter substrate-binding protein [Roseobacter denitrificans]SFF69652.1 extracellular solute-binding protein, family 5 Middle [Roseobacter denitrificans OCh 114]